MNHATTSPPVLTILIYVALIAMILFRMSRPQRISVTRMWFTPILLAFVGIFLIFEGQKIAPAPLWELSLAVVVGIALGIPVGLVRGAHTPVQATKEPGVMLLGSALIPALIYVAALALRLGLHTLFPVGSALGTLLGDGVFMFAIALLASSYVAIYRKFTALAASEIAA